MYLLGFILIFAGLSLLLYYFVQRYIGVTTNRNDKSYKTQADLPVVKATSRAAISSPDQSTDIDVVQSAESVVFEQPIKRSRPQPANRPKPARPILYATGYLYTDATHNATLLEHPDQAEATLTAQMKRLGPAIVRFRNQAFHFDHGNGLLSLPELQMKEIRFSDGAAIFVPKQPNLPTVYFFTVETQTIRDFLS